MHKQGKETEKGMNSGRQEVTLTRADGNKVTTEWSGEDTGVGTQDRRSTGLGGKSLARRLSRWSTCHASLMTKFNPQDPYQDGRKEPTPKAVFWAIQARTDDNKMTEIIFKMQSSAVIFKNDKMKSCRTVVIAILTRNLREMFLMS